MVEAESGSSESGGKVAPVAGCRIANVVAVIHYTGELVMLEGVVIV